jgi:magnesium-transporting ATPase (P-type)
MSGLSEVEAQQRPQSEGYNELPRQDRRTPFRIIMEVLRESMLALLLGGGFIYLLLGDLKEALILLGFAMMSVAITVIQETRTERVLEALRDLTSPRALVIRDGERRRIAGREVARGDLVVLAEGDRVPADAVLVQAHDVQADESLLTGESVPVRKIAATSRPAAPDRAATNCPLCIPVRWWRGAAALRMSWLPGRTAKLAGSASRSTSWKPNHRAFRCRPHDWSGWLRSAARPSALWRSYFTARCAVVG